VLLLYYFIIIALVISFIDWKYQLIPDVIMFPAIFFIVLIKHYDMSLKIDDFISVGLILIIFIIPIFFNMKFGGGDLRFGVFCALFVGLGNLGYFVIFAGLLHLLLLGMKKENFFGFAPSMSLSAVGVSFW